MSPSQVNSLTESKTTNLLYAAAGGGRRRPEIRRAAAGRRRALLERESEWAGTVTRAVVSNKKFAAADLLRQLGGAAARRRLEVQRFTRVILRPIGAARPSIAIRTRHPNTFPHFNFTFFGNFIKVAFADSTLPVLAPVLEPFEERTEQAEPGSRLGTRLRPLHLLLLLLLDPHRRLHEEGGGSRRDVEEHGGVGGLAGALRRRREVGKRRSPDVRRSVEGEEAGVLAEVGGLGGVFMEEGAAPPDLQGRVGSELGSLVGNVGFEVEGLLILSQELMQQRLMRHDC